jgi:hypothetical protein
MGTILHRLSCPGSSRVCLAAILALVVSAFAATTVRAQSAWYEGFEGPQVSWQPAGGVGRFQLLVHDRARGEAHTGDGCERLRIDAPNASAIYLSHNIGGARVIDELLPTVWLRSDRAGLQMLVRIVLPRTEDPNTRHPLTTTLAGTTYYQVGRWQQLRVDGLSQQLVRQVRVLRAQLGANVDAREAYVDQVVLNVRADNPPALNAYRRLGYVEHVRFEERLVHRLGSPWPDLAASVRRLFSRKEIDPR